MLKIKKLNKTLLLHQVITPRYVISKVNSPVLFFHRNTQEVKQSYHPLYSFYFFIQAARSKTLHNTKHFLTLLPINFLLNIQARDSLYTPRCLGVYFRPPIIKTYKFLCVQIKIVRKKCQRKGAVVNKKKKPNNTRDVNSETCLWKSMRKIATTTMWPRQ